MTYPNGGDKLFRASAQGQMGQDDRLLVLLNQLNQVRDAILQAKREQVINLRKAGLSYAAIGRRFCLSRERIRQIDKQISASKKPQD